MRVPNATHPAIRRTRRREEKTCAAGTAWALLLTMLLTPVTHLSNLPRVQFSLFLRLPVPLVSPPFFVLAGMSLVPLHQNLMSRLNIYIYIFFYVNHIKQLWQIPIQCFSFILKARLTSHFRTRNKTQKTTIRVLRALPLRGCFHTWLKLSSK